MDIYVVDLETTGLTGIEEDFIVEIAIMKVNLLSKRIYQVYHEIIRYDTSNWHEDALNAWIFENEYIKLEDVQNAEKNLSTVIKEVQDLLKNRILTAYNNDFDIGKFLSQNPWNIDYEKNKTKIAPCLMTSAFDFLDFEEKENKKGKEIRLEISKELLVTEEAESLLKNKELEEQIKQFSEHRANNDAFYSGCILLELYENNAYEIVPQIYYSHPMIKYKTEEEERELEILKESFPRITIINPSDFEEEWQELSSKEIMEKCLDLVAESDVLAFSGIEKEDQFFVGKGVYKEVNHAFKLGKKVYFLTDRLENKFSIDIYDDEDWMDKFARVILRRF